MNRETKIYSEFIKRNKIKVSVGSFSYIENGVEVESLVSRDDDGKWYADDDDKCYTKKAAIYWYLKNNTLLK